MRAYLPISQAEVESFLSALTIEASELYAPTPQFIGENFDCDDEELEYLLSIAAGEKSLELRASEKAPGIVLAFEVEESQIGEVYDETISTKAPLRWDQVQCALLAFSGDDELVWFATQEIPIHLGEWK